jgi:hypothetical protein
MDVRVQTGRADHRRHVPRRPGRYLAGRASPRVPAADQRHAARGHDSRAGPAVPDVTAGPRGPSWRPGGRGGPTAAAVASHDPSADSASGDTTIRAVVRRSRADLGPAGQTARSEVALRTKTACGRGGRGWPTRPSMRWRTDPRRTSVVGDQLGVDDAERRGVTLSAPGWRSTTAPRGSRTRPGRRR